ncbi:MAG: triose-phosphate isomerase [Coriobacteriia bacterium]
MERRPFVAGNWKMHTTSGEGAILVQKMLPHIERSMADVDVAVCPPFTGLKALSTMIELDRLELLLGAQDVHWEKEGAFTGEVSPRMLKELRVDYVIVGHSERRQFFGETDETVNKKVHAVLDEEMKVIVCVGESLATREEGRTDEFVRNQVRAALEGLDAERMAGVVIAYEPIWAIGTGRTPTPEQANDVARSIRATVGALFGQEVAMSVRIQYGGSVKPENAAMFLSEPDIDGALVGGASLDPEAFAAIVDAAR